MCEKCKTEIKNNLATKNPKLVEQWHPTKNGKLTAKDVTCSSHKKIWWKCQTCEYEWMTTVYNRNRGCCNCSKCNSLASRNPKLAKEWHSTKNENLTPFDILPGSRKKVWWICEKGHEWKAVINHRNNGTNCPYCSGRYASKESNLAIQNPEIAKQWHPTKNGDLIPENFTPYSSKKVWWKCKEKHEWKAVISNRNNGSNCPYCYGRFATKENNLAITNPKIAKEWHPTKNGDLTPFDVLSCSEKIIWWQCENGHEWKTRIVNRSNNNSCPYCSGRYSTKENNLAIQNPKLVKQWHQTKNSDLIPENFTPHSSKKVWWQCEKGHEWEAKIDNRSNGKNCPYCYGRYPSKENNLAVKNPKLAKQWHPIKNRDLTPFDVLPGINKKIWWVCERGHEWEATINHRNNGNGCPICNESKGERRIASFLKNKKISFIKQKTFVECKGFKRCLHYDFYLQLQETPLLIEYDGEQHFRPVNFGGISSKRAYENFKITKKYDEIKTEFAKKEGIKLLRINYTEFSKIEEVLERELLNF